MATFSVVMPVYGVEKFVAQAIESVLAQEFQDWQLIIVNDCSPDNSMEICARYKDSRIITVEHERNQGLAAARNSGIRASSGPFVAFLDSDDTWHPAKLKRHFEHLTNNPQLGLSFSRSAFMDEQGTLTQCYQMPKLKNIEPGHLYCRNPIGNGSAPVLRREALEAIAFYPPQQLTNSNRDDVCYFDPTLRQSEDIECWTRLALTRAWVIEGLPEALTYYRLNNGGLSANLHKQFQSWETMNEKLRWLNPAFIGQWGTLARAYQLRYISRQAIRMKDGQSAVHFFNRAIQLNWRIARYECTRTLTTAVAAYWLHWFPNIFLRMEQSLSRHLGRLQALKIQADIHS